MYNMMCNNNLQMFGCIQDKNSAIEGYNRIMETKNIFEQLPGEQYSEFAAATR